MTAGKAAGGGSAKKKAAGKNKSSGTQDVVKSPEVEAPARMARKGAAKTAASGAPKSKRGSPSQAKGRPAGDSGCGECAPPQQGNRGPAGDSPPQQAKSGLVGDHAECMVDDPIEVAKRTMQGSVPAIVEAMVKKAKQGSCPHAKTLLEMTGAKFMFSESAEMREAGEPWAKLVLERMEQDGAGEVRGGKEAGECIGAKRKSTSPHKQT